MSETSYCENRERPNSDALALVHLRLLENPDVISEGAAMGGLNWFSSRGVGAAANTGYMTAFNGTVKGRGKRGVLAVPDALDPPLSEDIKRRQVALILRYVTAIRAR